MSWRARPASLDLPLVALLCAAFGVANLGSVTATEKPKGDADRKLPWVSYPASSFQMGSTPEAMQAALTMCEPEASRALCERDSGKTIRSEGSAHGVSLSPFRLDRREVTVASYMRCVSAGACAEPALPSGDIRFNQPNFPVTHVKWEDAVAFCRFAKGRLPTEAEWEFAAGGTSHRQFPYGNIFNPRVCNIGSLGHHYTTDERDGYRYLAPVGALANCQTQEGVFDLAGNVAEWVHDAYNLDEAGHGYEPADVVDPQGPSTGAFHVIRGGSFERPGMQSRTAARGLGANFAPDVGFRCAYGVSP
jgi:formylglycine-generating enzyme